MRWLRLGMKNADVVFVRLLDAFAAITASAVLLASAASED